MTVRNAEPSRWGRRLLAAAAASVTVVLAGCGSSPSPGTVSEAAGEATITRVAPADRKPAPTVTGTTFDGKTFTLADHKKSLVVLNFWASWCPPCRAEGPGLVSVSTALAPQGVQFVGINAKENDEAAARAYAAAIKSTYPTVLDRDGTIGLAFTTNGTLPPDAIPSTLVVDREGRLAARILGPITVPRLTALLQSLVAEP